MTRRDSEVVLRHMRDALEAISEYTTGGRDEFFRSRLIQDAVIRNLEVLGEAAKQVPNEVRNRHPHIPWRRIAGLRDVLIPSILRRGLGDGVECRGKECEQPQGRT